MLYNLAAKPVDYRSTTSKNCRNSHFPLTISQIKYQASWKRALRSPNIITLTLKIEQVITTKYPRALLNYAEIYFNPDTYFDKFIHFGIFSVYNSQCNRIHTLPPAKQFLYSTLSISFTIRSYLANIPQSFSSNTTSLTTRASCHQTDLSNSRTIIYYSALSSQIHVPQKATEALSKISFLLEVKNSKEQELPQENSE